MKYIGIDLGTTNSAICSYDGETVRLYKSPDQYDVTPSAIFIDKRGNKYLGKRAYDNAAKNPDNAATKFKRMMGTSTPIKLTAVNLTMTPEECSAEILKLCFGYLPEEIRLSEDIGTVITVPAAFNQMQKDATLAAAEIAGLGKVALMQEPVAAVMSIMRQKKGDGVFLVFDLGGGTLDIAIAESISGRVNLLAHGGVAMCGGTDFDRSILDNIVKPWLTEHFDLPADFSINPKYKSLLRMSLWAAEKTKIELSAKEEAVISLAETDLGISDEAGAEIYIDIPFSRLRLNELIADKLKEAIQSARDTFEKAGLSPQDIECIVFVGGPTQYKPLRDKVAFELGVIATNDVNPMTAVAEGAAVFAESIDWASASRGRKNARGTLSADKQLNLSFDFIARTPDVKTRLVARLGGAVASGAEFQVDSLDTGWTSGRIALADGAATELVLAKPGENTFKIFVFDASGGPIKLGENKIVISRTAASIEAIPASHTISIAAKEKMGGPLTLVHLAREGDQLPKKGKVSFKAENSLTAGSSEAINFLLWEGDIKEPITDNRLVGSLKIGGKDFEVGAISAGAELIFEYEIQDSGRIFIEVSVPSIGGSFGGGQNFYSRQDGQIDFTRASKLIEEQAGQMLVRIEDMASRVDDERLEQAKEKLEGLTSANEMENDPEAAKQAMENIHEARRLLAHTREAHLKEIRQLELDEAIHYFDSLVRKHATPEESTAFDNLSKTAQRSIDSKGRDFELYKKQLEIQGYRIIVRQDAFIVEKFKWLSKKAEIFADLDDHATLVKTGDVLLQANDMQALREVVRSLDTIRIDFPDDSDMLADANIVRG
ncbi:Hsp70 family protein [Undibacterium sp.]|uniref:Hsp70 family protein n=1 Tax=Undibacterium sp. TaxID=1914977 RepID=UPI00374CAAB3